MSSCTCAPPNSRGSSRLPGGAFGLDVPERDFAGVCGRGAIAARRAVARLAQTQSLHWALCILFSSILLIGQSLDPGLAFLPFTVDVKCCHIILLVLRILYCTRRKTI